MFYAPPMLPEFLSPHYSDRRCRRSLVSLIPQGQTLLLCAFTLLSRWKKVTFIYSANLEVGTPFVRAFYLLVFKFSIPPVHISPARDTPLVPNVPAFYLWQHFFKRSTSQPSYLFYKCLVFSAPSHSLLFSRLCRLVAALLFV
jgi:hypothetical protein